MRFLFGDRCVDSDRMQILGPDGPIHVEPQVFEVVAMLVANRDRVVTKEELLDAVWGSRYVSESTLTSRIKSARRATGDTGTAQAVIRTVHGRGYQWVAPVTIAVDGAAGGSGLDGAAARAGAAAPAGAAATAPGRLPVAPPLLLDPLVGRETEVRQVHDAMRAARLVTIVGPGGVGKTRLALELLGDGPEAATAVVELAAVEEPEAVGDAVAAALGVQTGQRMDAQAACAEVISGSAALLLVDNCEHLREAVAAFLGGLAARCPRLRLLCTSRVPLGLPGEQVFPLGALALPEPDAPIAQVRAAPAVELFIARARRAAAAFSLDDATVAQIESLCRALDGLPLAIEFAASRSAALGLGGVAERLDRRLDLLGTDHPAPHARHSSLRATIEWSYELLDGDARAVLRHLCVFPAGVRLATVEHLAAAAGVGSEPAAIVARLVHASMLTRSDHPSGARFVPLESVRAFGVDQLAAAGEMAAAHEAMVSWGLGLVADVAAGIHTPEEPFWDDLVRRELGNLRAVRRYLIDQGRLAELVTLLCRLADWAEFREASEVWRWQLDLAGRTRGAPPEQRLPALAMVAIASWLSGRLDLAHRPALEAYDAGAAGWARAQAINMLANVDLFACRYESAARRWLERADIAEVPQFRSHSLALAALALGYAGAVDRARDLAARARAAAAEFGAPTDIARAEYVSGEIEHSARTGQEYRWLERAVATAEGAGARFIAGIAMVTLASARARAGDVPAAAGLYRQVVQRWLRTGTWTQLWTALRNAAELLLESDAETAVRIWAAADADPQAAAVDAAFAARTAANRDRAVARLGPARVAELERQARDAPRAEIAAAAAAALARLAS